MKSDLERGREEEKRREMATMTSAGPGWDKKQGFIRAQTLGLFSVVCPGH